MEFLNDLSEIIPVKMRIDFCRGYRLVSQHFLNGPQIRATFNKVGGKAMPEGVWTY